ncbi:MAG: entericidin B, partial [Paracoccaceae bacterium]
MTRSLALRIALIPLAFATLAACNTVQGVGEDVQAGGRALENSSEKVQ